MRDKKVQLAGKKESIAETHFANGVRFCRGTFGILNPVIPGTHARF